MANSKTSEAKAQPDAANIPTPTPDPNADFGPGSEEKATEAAVGVEQYTPIEELLAGLNPMPEGTDMAPYNTSFLSPISVKEDKDTSYVLLSGCIPGLDQNGQIQLITGVFFRFPSIPKGWGNPDISFVEHIQNHNATPYFRLTGGENFDISYETLVSSASEKAVAALDKFIKTNLKRLTDMPFMGNALSGAARIAFYRKAFRVRLEARGNGKVDEQVLTQFTRENYQAMNRALAGDVMQKQLSAAADLL